MQALKGFWQFLNTDVKEIPWGEITEKGIETVVATNEFGEAWKEQAPNIKKLQSHLPKVQPFLDSLDQPVLQLAIAGLPFVSIGIGLLRIYLDLSKIDPTYESSVAIAAQLAYLQSLEVVLGKVTGEAIKQKLQQVSLQSLVEKQLNRLGSKELTAAEAKVVTTRFRESVLAEQFTAALTEKLEEADLTEIEAQQLANQVGWGTHRYLHRAIAEAGERVEPLAEVYRTGGQDVEERYDSIATYLAERIEPLPQGQVFDENDPKVTFEDIYIPLNVQPLTQAGEIDREREPINIHQWALELLEQPTPVADQLLRKVMFVEGDAGRGKSVFCRMFANVVRQTLEFSYTPLLIRLRNLRKLANNLTETLEDCPDLEQVKFVRGDTDWLADRNIRFLIILDGFDELLLEGRASGGLKEFLQQVVDFQARSHHQCLVTGRPLALQGVDRLITQTKNLERVRLEPMNDELREQWLTKWQCIFDEAEVQKFKALIEALPGEISDSLAREPLLIYLLARLHREQYLTQTMFTNNTREKTDKQTKAKLRIYRESVNWVLEKQRQDENLRLAGLDDAEDLHEVLRETALCIVQSGNETAHLNMLRDRFQDKANPVATLFKQSQQAIQQSESKALNNLLTTFYLKPGEGDQKGSIEFAHKSFGEYLFAERLKTAFEDWTALDRRCRPNLDDRAVNVQIYDLLGYGSLSVEILDYLFELLIESDIDKLQLFKRLSAFYERWCRGEFLDQGPTQNLPQQKMLQLQTQGVFTGLRQVDIFTGLNVLTILFKLHSTAQQTELETSIKFIISNKSDTEELDNYQLAKIIYYADSLEIGTFVRSTGLQLKKADLNGVNLDGVRLEEVNLDSASLKEASLKGTRLYSANLNNANLEGARLDRAILDGAILDDANLENARLYRTILSGSFLNNANLKGADLEGARLEGVFLNNANLENADLKGANLEGAILYQTNLKSANLEGAILKNTVFESTNLEDTNLLGAKFQSAKLSQEINREELIKRGAIFEEK